MNNNNNNNNCDNNNRNNNLNNNNNRNNNVEFGTMGSTSGMSQEARANSQAAAQKLRNMSNLNGGSSSQSSQFKSEFASGTGNIGQGVGAQGYNAYSEGAKAGTQAAAKANRSGSTSASSASNQFTSEFGSGSMPADEKATSEETAKMLRKSNLPNQGNQSK